MTVKDTIKNKTHYVIPVNGIGLSTLCGKPVNTSTEHNFDWVKSNTDQQKIDCPNCLLQMADIKFMLYASKK